MPLSTFITEVSFLSRLQLTQRLAPGRHAEVKTVNCSALYGISVSYIPPAPRLRDHHRGVEGKTTLARGSR